MSPCLRRPACAGSLLLLFLACPPHAQEQKPEAAGQSERTLQLSLEDALRVALKNNLDLEIDRLATEQSRYQALGSWGAFDPVFTATGTASQSETEGSTRFNAGTDDDLSLESSLAWPFPWGGSLQLSERHNNSKTDNQFATFDVSTTDIFTVAYTQPLLRGAWTRYGTVQQKRSVVELELQLERERETRARILLDTTNAYWDVVSAQEELAVRELAVELGKQQLGQDRRRLEVGAGTEVDVLQAETNVAQQEEQRVSAYYRLRQARDTLRRMLSPRPEGAFEEFLDAWDWPIETLTALPEVQAGSAEDWRASLQRALEQRPELVQRRLEIETSELELLRTTSERRARLDLDLSTSSAGFDTDPAEAFSEGLGWDFPSSSAALTFSMPILNRTARHAENAARTALRSARLSYDRNELDVLADVRSSVNSVAEQRESVAAASKSRTLAQRQLEAEETRQEVGLSTTFQVLQFQEDLAQALSTEVAAKAAYAKALAKLLQAEGALDQELSSEAGESARRAPTER
ncbi:MAG: TolC family protein [Planctomycetota bacterium]